MPLKQNVGSIFYSHCYFSRSTLGTNTLGNISKESFTNICKQVNDCDFMILSLFLVNKNTIT